MSAEIRREEIQKLARLINDALDSGSLQAGLLTPDLITPFDQQHPEIRGVIMKAAEVVYEGLVYDKAVGEIRVIPGGVKV